VIKAPAQKIHVKGMARVKSMMEHLLAFAHLTEQESDVKEL